MNLASAASAQPTRQWTVEGFARFWANPQNPEITLSVMLPEIKGYWPRGEKPLEGKDDYFQGIINFLNAVPGFQAEVTDAALNGNVALVRWVATGKPPVGPETLVGVDRLILRDGFVLENYIHSDHPVFVHLAKTKMLG